MTLRELLAFRSLIADVLMKNPADYDVPEGPSFRHQEEWEQSTLNEEKFI